jgi:hypothetical protein
MSQYVPLPGRTQVEPAELGCQRTGLADACFFLQPGDQIDGVEVATAGAGTHYAGSDRDGQMRLSRARAAHSHDIALAWQEGASVQRADQSLRLPQPLFRNQR